MRTGRGRFITLEGNEGCGKSTQIGLLERYLERKGCLVLRTREPGGTFISDRIRDILLDCRSSRMTAMCETMLYMASRTQLVDEVIRPALNRGCIVLCDRWLDATVAYQGYGAGVSVPWIKALGCQITGGLKPNLSLFLDLPVETGLGRAKKRSKKADRIERKSLEFHRKVRRGYLEIVRKDRRRVRVIRISAKDGIDAVFAQVRKTVDDVISR